MGTPPKARGSRTKARYHLRFKEGLVEIPEGELVIGRASDCHLTINDGLVSRRHARVTNSGNALLVEDLASRNGVLVNERKIHGPSPIEHGDRIGIGLASLQVVDELMLHRPENMSTMPPPAAAGHQGVDEQDEETTVASLEVLTEREREVLELLVRGYTQREMAERLHVSIKTVETHRANIVAKLDCHSRAEIVSYAVSAGLLRSKPPAR